MKSSIFYTIALACCVGIALADWDALGYGGGYGYGGMGASLGGYGGYGKASYVPVYPSAGRGSGIGNGGIIAMIGLLVILFALFGSNTGTSDQIVLVNSTLSG